MSAPVDRDQNLRSEMSALGFQARAAARRLRDLGGPAKTKLLLEAATSIRRCTEAILHANAGDVADAEAAGLSAAALDRLRLDDARIEAMAAAVESISALPDPVGRELAHWRRPNGLEISRVTTPIGVIAMIYESRPNVTADAAALCLKSGNAVILRGGSEARRSNAAIHEAFRAALPQAGFPLDAVQLVSSIDRAAVGMLLQGLDGAIDLAIPRGGRNLVSRVRQEARVPVLAHLEGVCHVYLHEKADPRKAQAIALNSKMRRTGVCGAAETLLVDRTALTTVGVPVLEALASAGCEIRGDDAVCGVFPTANRADEEDWAREYLDAIIAVKVVDGPDGAIRHIETHGSHHTESIVTEDAVTAERFLAALDSAIVMWNASTQFADGGEFGMGAEMGIATGKLHARGPVGAEQLTTFKYVVRGTGQVRP